MVTADYFLLINVVGDKGKGGCGCVALSKEVKVVAKMRFSKSEINNGNV